jgi:hypothetical protein
MLQVAWLGFWMLVLTVWRTSIEWRKERLQELLMTHHEDMIPVRAKNFYWKRKGMPYESQSESGSPSKSPAKSKVDAV